MPDANILIVEDNPLIAEDIRNMLAVKGYTSVTIANGPKAALEAAAARRLDIALMDIHLGDTMIGIDTAMALRQKHQVPVIYITAFADEDTVERAKLTEPYGYIVKPLDENELFSTLETALYKVQSDRSIKESQIWLKTTLQCIGDGVIATDKEGRVVFLNPVAEDLTGWRQTEALGCLLEKIFRIVGEGDFDQIEDPIKPVFLKQASISPTHYTELLTKLNRKTPIAYSGAPIRNERGDNIGVVLVFRDQTEERLAQQSVEIRIDLIEYAISHTLEDLLRKTLDVVGDVVKSPIGFYHFVAADQETLSLQQWSTRTLKEFCTTEGHGLHYSIHQAGVWTDCVKKRMPVVHNDYPSLPHKKGLPEGHAEVVRELVVPVMRENRVVAILGVGNKPADYTERDVKIVSSLADVTWEIINQKRVEQQLRKSEERYRGVIEDTPVLICRFLSDFTISFVNNAYCNYFKKKPEELIGSTFLSAIPIEDRDTVKANISALTRQSPTQTHEHQVVASDRSIRWQRWTNRALFNNAGELIGYQSIGEDITEHKHAENELSRTLLEWQTTFDAVNAAIWILDKKQRIVRSNKNIEKIISYPYEEVIGRHCWEVFHKNSSPDHSCPLPTARKSLQREIMETEIDEKWFEVTVDPIVDEKGEYAGAVHIVTDITKRKRSDHEKEKLQAQLIQSQKMESVGRLAGGVAHDFNNMLSVIIGHAELAMDRASDESPMRQDLLEIYNAAIRSANLTRQLLAFARKQEAIPVVLDLNDAVTGTLKMLQRIIGEDIELLWKPGANLWPILMDPAQLDQILANLCVNSRDAIRGGGKITIETRKETLDDIYCTDHPGFLPGEYVMLTVSDNGHGISKDILENIFEPFFTTKEAERGTGLGLATVYGIVKQNSGFVNVYSEPGKGATFRIYLPRTQKRIEDEEEVVKKAAMGGTETILLVEDETSILKLTEKVLIRFGYAVLSAQTPAEAINLARRHSNKIRLMITDVVMPEMNGQELKEEIKKIVPEIKTVFMSGYTADVISHHGILEGEIDYLPKPFSVEALGTKVRNVLDHTD